MPIIGYFVFIGSLLITPNQAPVVSKKERPKSGADDFHVVCGPGTHQTLPRQSVCPIGNSRCQPSR
jgi:hypothetical protein